MLFFRRALASDRRRRAAAVEDVNFGMAGGRDAQRRVAELRKD